MCARCDWPYKLVIDEDKSDESFTSDIIPSDQWGFKITTRDLTYIPRREKRNDS